mgnify:CR=1 FL=1
MSKKTNKTSHVMDLLTNFLSNIRLGGLFVRSLAGFFFLPGLFLQFFGKFSQDLLGEAVIAAALIDYRYFSGGQLPCF